MNVNVYKLNESDYVAATSLDQAKRCLAETISNGVVDSEFEGEYIEKPVVLSTEEMDRLKMLDEEGVEKAMADQKTDVTGDEWEQRYEKYAKGCPSFKDFLTDRLKTEEAPFYFASSEY